MNRIRRPVRIALVNAPPFALHEPQYDTPAFTRYSLAVLAGYLRDHGFADLLLIDAKFERIGYREVHRRLQAFEPDIVGHTAFTNEIVQSGHVATLVRALSRELGKPICNIVGGVHATALPEQTLQEFPQFDLVCVGDGEQTLLELCQHWGLGQGLEGIQAIAGLAWRTPGDPATVQRSPERPRIQDQDEIPMPAWDLLPRSSRVLVMTSRGCPYACNFCMNPNGKRVRKRGVDHFLEEVRWLVQERDCVDLHICDEIFTIDKARTHEILDGMIELGFGTRYTFHAQTHINTVDEELLLKIDRAGCRLLGFGLETGDPDTLKQMGKGTNLNKIREIVDLTKKTGIKLGTFFILGQPDESWASAWNTVKLAIDANPETPIFGVMVPYPGTKVWEWAQRGERGYHLKSLDWNDYNKQIGDALAFDGIDRRGIEFMQLAGYSLVFLRNRRYREFAEFVWRYRTEGATVLNKIVTGHLGRTGRPRGYDLELDTVLELDGGLPHLRTFDPGAPLPVPAETE